MQLRACHATSPYLTSTIIHVLQQAVRLGYTVNPNVLERAYTYLDEELATEPPVNAEWMASYTSWQAFAVKTLAEGGRNQDSNRNRLMGYAGRMPVFALAYLHDALLAANDARALEIRRRIANAILPEGGSAHVEELNDPNLQWLWSSNVRTTAIVLGTLVRGGGDETIIRGLVRWLMDAREDGRWGNTQENAWAMESLVDYYRKYESEVPDFRATVVHGSETLARETFAGRSTEARTRDIPMNQLLAKAPAGQRFDLIFRKEGAGTLHYLARLRYASAEPVKSAMNQGFAVERTYAPMEGKDAGSMQSYAAGDRIRVTLKLRLPKERRWVAVTDPIPAGFEPVESWFKTTAARPHASGRGGVARGKLDGLVGARRLRPRRAPHGERPSYAQDHHEEIQICI